MDQTCESDKPTLSKDELRVLGKLDERTKRIDDKLDGVIESAEENADDIEETKQKVKRNTTILSGYSAGLMSITLWAADKIAPFT